MRGGKLRDDAQLRDDSPESSPEVVRRKERPRYVRASPPRTGSERDLPGVVADFADEEE
jgi:hypothetical protein